MLDPALADKVSKQAAELLADFPLYPAAGLGYGADRRAGELR
ncbi:hypothetical protein ACVCAH_13320 [Micromonospora sp. LZ34]